MTEAPRASPAGRVLHSADSGSSAATQWGRWISIAIKQVLKVSDLSGAEGASDDFGRLVVRGYPDVGGPRVLDVLPSEVPDFPIPDGIVILEYKAPGSSTPRTLVALRADFDQLALNMEEVIAEAPSPKAGAPEQEWNVGRGSGTRRHAAPSSAVSPLVSIGQPLAVTS